MSHFCRAITVRMNRNTGQPHAAVTTNRGRWYVKDISWKLLGRIQLMIAVMESKGLVSVVPSLYIRKGHETIGWTACRIDKNGDNDA